MLCWCFSFVYWVALIFVDVWLFVVLLLMFLDFLLMFSYSFSCLFLEVLLFCCWGVVDLLLICFLLMLCCFFDVLWMFLDLLCALRVVCKFFPFYVWEICSCWAASHNHVFTIMASHTQEFQGSIWQNGWLTDRDGRHRTRASGPSARVALDATGRAVPRSPALLVSRCSSARCLRVKGHRVIFHRIFL